MSSQPITIHDLIKHMAITGDLARYHTTPVNGVRPITRVNKNGTAAYKHGATGLAKFVKDAIMSGFLVQVDSSTIKWGITEESWANYKTRYPEAASKIAPSQLILHSTFFAAPSVDTPRESSVARVTNLPKDPNPTKQELIELLDEIPMEDVITIFQLGTEALTKQCENRLNSLRATSGILSLFK